MDKTKTVSLQCVFCHSTKFELPHKDYVPSENDTIKCANCQKLNIYADIRAISAEREIEAMSKDIIKDLKKLFK